VETYDLVNFDSLEINSEENSSEQCDVCGSKEIIETFEGYSCQECGIVLEVQKLEYNRPYDEDILQHSVINKTQIGNKKERSDISGSLKFESLNRLDTRRSYEEVVLTTAKIEIRRILTALKFSQNDFTPLLSQFKKIHSQIAKGTKFRNPTLLVPCIIYAFYKEQNKPINERELLEVAHVSKKDFSSFKLSILRMWPQYQERNRKAYVVRRIFEVVEHFNFGMPFFYQSKRVLNKFYKGIKNTKDEIIVGLVCSITLLCSQTKEPRVSHLCDMLGIKMSAIQKQVERKIFTQFQIGGYKSLVKSAGLLKKIMTKLGVIESKEKPEEKDMIQLTLGSTTPIFNAIKELEYYFFVQDPQELIVAFVDSPNYNETAQGKKEISSTCHASKVELWKYYSPVGPPEVK
jgi:hypothetical protein